VSAPAAPSPPALASPRIHNEGLPFEKGERGEEGVRRERESSLTWGKEERRV